MTNVTEKVTNDTLSAPAVDDIIIAEEKNKFAYKRREAMLFIVITLVILGIWILLACIDARGSDIGYKDNTEDTENSAEISDNNDTPTDNNDNGTAAGKIVKTLLIILLIVLIIGIIGFMVTMNEIVNMFDSCCTEIEKVRRIG